MSDSLMLSVEHLRKTFKSGNHTITVLDDISFSVESGSACAIVGPSGSGKTTLIAICAGLERPSSGSVFVFDNWGTNATDTSVTPVTKVVGGTALDIRTDGECTTLVVVRQDGTTQEVDP